MPDINNLKEIGDQVYRNLLKTIFKFRDHIVGNKNLARLRALYQVTCLQEKAEKYAVGFIKKMIMAADE